MYDRIGARLDHTDGSYVAVESLSWRQELDVGMSWQAEARTARTDLLAANAYGWTVYGSGNQWSSFGMWGYAQRGNQINVGGGVRRVSLSGVDVATAAMDGETVDGAAVTSSVSSTAAILAVAGAVWNGGFGSVVNFYSPDGGGASANGWQVPGPWYTQGATGRELVARACRDWGNHFYVDSAGRWSFYPMQYQPDYPHPVYVQDTDVLVERNAPRVDGVLLRSILPANTMSTGELNDGGGIALGSGLVPGTIEAYDAGREGRLSYAAFYSGAVPGTGSLVAVRHFHQDQLATGPGGTPDPSLVAQSVKVGVTTMLHNPNGPDPQPATPRGTIVVKGRLNNGDFTGGAFQRPQEYLYPPGATGNILVIESTLFPTLARMQTVAPLLYFEVNKSRLQVRRVIRFDPRWVPGFYLPADDDAPRMRVDVVEQVVREGQAVTTIQGPVAA